MSNTQSTPVHRLVIYRPKQGHFDQLKAILLSHGPALKKTGLITSDPVKLWSATDLQREGMPLPYFVESFYWRDAKAAGSAHETPEVMAVWETMGPHLEEIKLATLEPLV